MSTIGPTELAAYLRGQLGALRKTAATDRAAGSAATLGGNTRTGAAQAHKPQTSSKAAPQADMATVLARRVLAIDAADPDRRRKAFRLFLECLLLDELGQQLINDPGFYQLVETVQAEMETRADLREMMDEAGARLLANPSTGLLK